MAKSKTNVSESHSLAATNDEQIWSENDREAWVSMAIAAATQSLRLPDFSAMNDSDEHHRGDD